MFKKKLSILLVSSILGCQIGISSAGTLSPSQATDQPFNATVSLVSAADSETVIAPTLNIPADHQGKKANLYAISIDNQSGFAYVKSAQGWDAFDSKITSYSEVTLGASLEMPLVSGKFCEQADGRIFYGYSLDDSPSIYHGNGMKYVVSETAKNIQGLLDNIVADEDTHGVVPGIVLGIGIPGEGRFYAASGLANMETKEAMKPDYLFRAGSITKTFTGAGILKLVDEGKLNLDDNLESLVPDLGVQNSESMQVKHLLAHTAGNADYAFNDDWWQALMLEEDTRTFTPKELIGLSNSVREFAQSNFPVDFQAEVLGIFEPGSVDVDGNPHTHYSNTNYGLLGMVIESVTGKTYEQVMQESIIDEFGLSNTTFPINNDATMPVNSATGYNNWVQQGFPIVDSPTLSVPASATCNNSQCVDELLPQPEVEGSLSWAIGNVITNTEDLMDWITAMVKRNVFSYATEEAAFGFSTINPTNDVGLGIARYYNNLIGHRGQLPGFDAVMEYDMDLDIPIVAAINRSFFPNAEGEISNINEIVVLPVRELLNSGTLARRSVESSYLPPLLKAKAEEYQLNSK